MSESEAAIEVNRQEGTGVVFAFGETRGELDKGISKEVEALSFPKCLKNTLCIYYLSSTS